MSWTDRPERGSRGLMRFMVGVALGLGWRAGHALLYPITLYFLLRPSPARAASRRYLALALGRPPGFADQFRHYLAFASTILDRVFLLTGRTAGYDIRVSGLEHVVRHVEAGRGCILLGAHLGSFEVLRALADRGCPVPVRALMYEGNAARTNEVLNALNPGRAGAVIPLGTPGSLLRVREALAAGELVGMLGDRIVRGDKVVTVGFMGRRAVLPAGPVVLASMLKAPVVLFFGLHLGPRRYEIAFEPFAPEGVTVAHRDKLADVAAWVQRYADRLEAVCRAHPYNWFNFHDFWAGDDGVADPGGRRLLARGGALLRRARERRRGRDRPLDGSALPGAGEPGRVP